MERQERTEDLRSRFRELAAEVDRVHQEWQDAAGRDDFPKEKRLIARETELLAEIDEVVREFRDLIGPKRLRR